MTTKDQERKALEKIKKIIAELGEDSYVGTAFDGCIEDAEDNIENDFAMSMKDRMEKAEAARNELEKHVKEMRQKIEKMEADLEREQEWKPWVDERAVPQAEYDHLAAGDSAKRLTDEAAKEWIADEFGFDRSKIRIHREMKLYEVNRHHLLRTVGTVDRSPLYEATDWYYVFFSVCGMEYEASNGNLNQI